MSGETPVSDFPGLLAEISQVVHSLRRHLQHGYARETTDGMANFPIGVACVRVTVAVAVTDKRSPSMTR